MSFDLLLETESVFCLVTEKQKYENTLRVFPSHKSSLDPFASIL